MSNPRAFRVQDTIANSPYPRLLGRDGAVASENYLATNAAADVLKAGGNAVDAMVAGVLVENVVDPHMNSLGGECPILIAMAGMTKPVVINGNTVAPAAADIVTLRAAGYSDMPSSGVMAAGVPATLSALLTALEHFGTMSFADVSCAARAIASEGFPVHRGIVRQHKFGLDAVRDFALANWPGTAELYFPGGRALAEGEIFVNRALGGLLESLAAAERARPGRAEGIRAVHDAFYAGEAAAIIDRFVSERGGLLRRDDLAAYHATVEAPVAYAVNGITLFKCGYWNQGPALLQALAMLDRLDIGRHAHNSAAYIHLVAEAMKLGFADREQYFGDPRQLDGAAQERLLAPDYVALRAALIDAGAASHDFRPGDPLGSRAVLPREERVPWGGWGHGTVHVDTADKHGNMVSATPSGAWIKDSEVIPELGFPLGNRLMTFYFEPDFHPNLLMPGRMPRTTISPSLAYRDGAPWMAFGSMGGDQQDQWQLQFFLNCAVFGMTVREAIDAPKFSTDHAPAFFAPHSCAEAHLRVERTVGAEVLAELARAGHAVEAAPEWTEGFLLGVMRDPGAGVLEAGCDPRCAKSEIFAASAMAW